DLQNTYTFEPATTTISVGGTIVFGLSTVTGEQPVGDSFDVIFDDTTGIHASCNPLFGCDYQPETGEGNIETIVIVSEGTPVPWRRFDRKGTYHFFSRTHSVGGTILVQ